MTTRKELYSWISLAAALVLLYGGMHLAGITCPIKYMTGISCAGCGMTRAAFALVRGNIHQAYYYHPLVFLMPLIPVLYLYRNHMKHNVRKFILVMIIGLFIAVYLFRMADPANEIVAANPETGLIFRVLGK